MTDYTELVKALRETATFTKFDDLLSKREQKLESLAFDAAAAIEELDAEETRLLLITSELQDKVVELEEELNDADIAADDNARQVEELQAQLPKRGEWIYHPKDAIEMMFTLPKCSICGHESSDALNYCPNCGARMEVQE